MANLRTAIIGLLAGAFGGLLGLGGGVVMVPLLTGWSRLSQHRAHATSLVAVVFTGLVGGWAYAISGAVDWGVAVLVAAAATFASAWSASRASKLSAFRLRQYFGIMLIAVAFLLPFGEQLTGAGISGGLRIPAALGIGAFAGLLTGLLGVGGGSVVVPLLILVFGFDQHLAQGTSLAVMVPAGVAGTVVHWRHRSIAASVVPGLIAGIAIGAFLGGRLALGIPELPLQLVFVALMIWTGVRYLRRGRQSAAASAVPTATGAAAPTATPTTTSTTTSATTSTTGTEAQPATGSTTRQTTRETTRETSRETSREPTAKL